MPRLKKWLKRLGFALGLVIGTILAVRAWDAWRSPPLEPWHTEAPRELDARALDKITWQEWLAAEDVAFEDMRRRVTDKLPPSGGGASRFAAASPLNPERFATNWNRSYILQPDGTPRGAVVLLHGLSDSPYSLRHIAASYREHGFVTVSIRMPGHGTVPAGLTQARWEDWAAATRLAVRTARALAGDNVPLHIVGYSNGGALALEYALESLSDDKLPRASRLVLISPMIGVTSFARFAGVLGWPAVFPAFAKAAWLDVLPEYNPFKYNSFPVNAARQSSQLVRTIDAHMVEAVESGAVRELPPVLTFQSVLDSTVVASAIFTTLYDRLPNNGSEIVLFDRNLAARIGPLFRPASADALGALVPPGVRRYSVTTVTNAAGDGGGEEARTVAAEGTVATTAPLEQRYPQGTYSLSHVALPFPPRDGLYGSDPDPQEDFGVRLGTVAVRGERGALVVSTETLMRATSNPFFDYLLKRIEETM